MMIRAGDTQELPDIGVFEWDGVEFWVCGDIRHTHKELYTLLVAMDKKFDVQSVGGKKNGS